MLSGAPAKLYPGECLFSRNCTYQVSSFLGQGTFGSAIKSTRLTDMKTVVLKIMKNDGYYKRQAAAEVNALLKIKSLNPDKCNLVRWYGAFTDRDLICLEFEQLHLSIYGFMSARYFRPLPLVEIRPFVMQIATALGHLKGVGLIHADLKVENVMLVNHVQMPYRVKVIDFGLAHGVSATVVGSHIQSRPYRSPEIILGLQYTEAIDIWSLGCLGALLCLGTFLYNGLNEYDMLRYIMDTQGQLPDNILNSGSKTSSFFLRDDDSITSQWRLKTPQQFLKETGITATENRKFKLRSLDDLLHIYDSNAVSGPDKLAENKDLLAFVHLIKSMLLVDAAERITPCQVLKHPFISMCHMVHLKTTSFHAQSSFQIMDICKKGRTLLQTLSSATLPFQQDRPPPPFSVAAEKCSLFQQQSTGKHPRTSTSTVTSVRTGSKRKTDEINRNMNETSSKRKCQRVKHGHRETFAGPTTHSSSQEFSNHIQAGIAAIPGVK